MKITTLSIMLALASFVGGSMQAQTADVKTLSGRVYKAARVSKVEPDGLTYYHAGGIAKVAFDDLPEDVRKKYGYDAQKAAAFAQADDAAQVQAQLAVDEEMRSVSQAQRAAQIESAKSLAAAKPVQESAPRSSNPLNAPAMRRDPVNGTVFQIVTDGMLVLKDDRKDGEVVMISGYPKQDAVVERAKCSTICQLVGSYEYQGGSGTSHRVREFKFTSGTVTNPM